MTYFSALTDATPFKWTFSQTIKHQLFDALVLIGLRDRLRCPKCRAVGTWKPHGGWFEFLNRDHRSGFIKEVIRKYGAKEAHNRRWLCKYCGFNVSTEGVFQCCPDGKTKVWAVREQAEQPTPTPKERVGPDIWPWRG
jgi:hypothetical protein